MLIHILTSPRVHTRLMAEFTAPPVKISSPITDVEARQLPYLQAVIKESMRVLPPAIGADFREVPLGGDVLCGKFVPAGTWVGLNWVAMLMNKECFGHDATLFRPERWLSDAKTGQMTDARDDEKRIRRMEQDLELAFSYGKSQCLGKNIALMELNKVVAEVSRVQ